MLKNPVLREGTGLRVSKGYDAKADLWSMGCIMYGMLCKELVCSKDVRTLDELVHGLAQEMRTGTQKTLPEHVVCEDGRGFDGPKEQYNQAAEESPASRECRLILAKDAGVAEDRVWIIGGSENATLRTRGKVVVKYKRAVDVSVECRDLLGRLLTHNPEHRISWSDFFNHAWLQ
jgi:serine/threonine protein kinase